MNVRASQPLAEAEAVGLPERYVGAYNDRDLEAMLALRRRSSASRIRRRYSAIVHTGATMACATGGRRWRPATAATRSSLREISQIGSDGVAALGEIHEHGELLSP